MHRAGSIQPAAIVCIRRAVFAQAGDNVEYCHTLEEMLEFVPKCVSKVSGIKYLARASHLTIDSIITMGDGNNDIGMLKECGLGIAVQTAPPAVREAADYVIHACAASGPKRFLRYLIKKRT